MFKCNKYVRKAQCINLFNVRTGMVTVGAV